VVSNSGTLKNDDLLPSSSESDSFSQDSTPTLTQTTLVPAPPAPISTIPS
jgi:hypothetical protein